MVFSSTVFLFLFLPAVWLLYYNPIVKKSRALKNGVLLLTSLMFYGWGEPVFVFFMMLSILITWYLGLRLQKTRSRTVLIAGIVYHAAVLFVFKYLAFTVREAGALFGLDLSAFQIALPIGISFFTFQLMSYLFDVYYQTAKAQENPLYLGLYTALFPQLIAGPIVRYKDVAEQITKREESFSNVMIGMRRFVYGLGKKVLIADYMAQIADTVFELSNRSVLTAWLGAIAYALQIYFDFSGYSDMAIGLGKMFGFDFPPNFNFPYISRSVTEFWRRWHISLSSWFRDYVYIPLGGSRVKKGRWIFNLFVVWLLTGLWHGANWTFLLWGMIYFVVLLMEKVIGLPEKMGVFGYLYTGLVVVLAWVVFRADTVSLAVRYLGNMFGIGAEGLWDDDFIEMIGSGYLVLLLAVFGMTPVFRKCCAWLEQKGLQWLEQIWLLFVFAFSIAAVVGGSYEAFIYFNF